MSKLYDKVSYAIGWTTGLIAYIVLPKGHLDRFHAWNKKQLEKYSK